MKKRQLFTLLCLTLSVITISAQEKYIKAETSGVTVFTQGAQVYSEVPFSLQQGTYDIVAGGLSPYIDVNSIQVKGEGSIMILGVTHRNNYLENAEESSRNEELRAKIEALKTKIEDEQTAIEVLIEKEAFLKANYDIVTNKTTVSSEQLKSFIDLYSSNTEAVKFALLKKRRSVREYEKEKQKLEQQLSGSIEKSRLPSGEIVISVSCTKQVTGRLKLSYMVMNAGWYPSYDIRIDNISGPATIVYKANIWQRSGVDWKDVKISLSNASPMAAGALPDLYPWFLDFYNPPVAKALEGRAAGVNVKSAKAAYKTEYIYDEEEAEDDLAVPVTVNETTTSFNFDINVSKTISSGDKPEAVELQHLTVPATYIYESVPKKAGRAYLMGKITGWEKYNLLSGASNIYFENTFTGKGSINTAELSDTLSLSLGADNSITVKREKRTDFSSQKMIGTNRVETISFLISVRNNKKQNISLRLKDQIPLSQNSDIDVEAAELSGGRLNTTTGEVVWELAIEPQQTKTVVLTYSVKYPKARKVILE